MFIYMHTKCGYSLRIPGADEDLMRTYEDLLPKEPRIIDPVNPSNNVYLSGIGGVAKGDGKWDVFAAKIDSLKLEHTEMQLMGRKFEFCEHMTTNFT